MTTKTLTVSSESNAAETTLARRSEKMGNIVWRNVIVMSLLHLIAIYGFYLALVSTKYYTLIFDYVLAFFGGLGITAGAHRLWSHKTYKAKLPLRIILGVFNTLAMQNSIYEWSRDHRVHHKFTETDADPHNSKRGLFFSHVGWLLVRKHPDVMQKGKRVDLNDLLQDGVVVFQKKYYLSLAYTTCFVFPTLVPMLLWGETFVNSFSSAVAKYIINLHFTWFVNSLAHFYGGKPFDKNMKAAQNAFVSWGALGEGWHNYHHAFPWDYKTAELGNYSLNFTAAFIDFFAWVGWAYDLKTTSPEVIMKRATRTGDGTYVAPPHYPSQHKDFLDIKEEHSHAGEVWGWDDDDLDPEIKSKAIIVNCSLKKE